MHFPVVIQLSKPVRVSGSLSAQSFSQGAFVPARKVRLTPIGVPIEGGEQNVAQHR